VVACLLAAAALAGCTGSPAPEPTAQDPLPSGASPAPSASAAPGPTATGNRRLRLVPVARVPLRGLPLAAGVRLVGQRLLLAGCHDCARDGDTGGLYTHDLRTGRIAKVAATAFRRGAAVPLGGAGDQVVWQDVAPVAPQLGGRTQWRLEVLDLRTGRSRRLAGTTATTRSAAAWTVVRDGLIAWQVLSGDTLQGPVQVADVRSGTSRVVARPLPGPLADVTARSVLYVGAWPPGGGRDVGDPDTPSDAYALPLAGGPTRALSASHDVGSVATDGTTAVWTTPRGASTAVWAAPLAGGPGQVVYRGGNVERVPGDGFVAVLTDGDPVLRVAPLAGGPVLTVPDVPLPAAGLATDGARLAYVAVPERGLDAGARRPLELVVVEVR
jgi:hypothetical protein